MAIIAISVSGAAFAFFLVFIIYRCCLLEKKDVYEGEEVHEGEDHLQTYDQSDNEDRDKSD